MRALVESGDIIGAAVLFLQETAEAENLASFPDWEAADIFLGRVLPAAVVEGAGWFLDLPGHALRCLRLAREALQMGYRKARMVHCIAYLCAILAVRALLDGDENTAKKALLAASGQEVCELETILKKPSCRQAAANGDISHSAVLLLDGLEGDVSDSVRTALLDVVHRLKWPRAAPGVVWGLFVDRSTGDGVARRIVVRVKLSEEKGWAHAEGEKLADDTEAAVRRALDAAHRYLLRRGYPDGLQGRRMEFSLRSASLAPVPGTEVEGPSLALPLCVATVSAATGVPAPQDVALTGDIDTLAGDRVLPVAGVERKVAAAARHGLREVWLPAGQQPAGCQDEPPAIRHAYDVAGVCDDLLLRAPGGSPFLEALHSRTHRFRWTLHVVMASLLLASLHMIETVQIYFAYCAGVFPFAGFVTTVVAVGLAVFAAGLLCHRLPPLFLRHRNRNAWPAAAVITLIAHSISFLLLSRMVWRVHPDIAVSVDWPPVAVVFKDLTIMAAFAISYPLLMHSIVWALEELANRRQVVTLKRLLAGDLMYNLPLVVVPLSIRWYLVITSVSVVTLLAFELLGFSGLRDIPQSMWYTGFGVIRDLLFLAAAVECLGWYFRQLVRLKTLVETPFNGW